MGIRRLTACKRAILAGLVVICAIGLVGCGSSGDDSAAGDTTAADTAADTGAGGAAEELTTVKAALLPIATAAPVYIGIEKGFFRDEGIDLQPQIMQGGSEILTAVQSNAAQFGFVGYVPLIVARSKGLPVRMVVATDSGAETPEDATTAIVVGPDSPVQSVQDLAGKTIGVNLLKGLGEVLIKASLEQQGVDPSSIELLEVPFPDMPVALESGSVDAIWVPDPFLTMVLDKGGRIIDTPLETMGPNFPNGGFAASDEYIAEHRDVVDRFVRAMNRSTEYAQSHIPEVREILPTYTQTSPEGAANLRLPIFTSTIDLAGVEKTAELTERYGIIETIPPIDEIVLTDSE